VTWKGYGHPHLSAGHWWFSALHAGDALGGISVISLTDEEGEISRNKKYVSIGVPQGSVRGPMPPNYCNSLRATAFVRLNTDLWIMCPRTHRMRSHRSVSQHLSIMYVEWMHSNRLQLNAAKTEILWSTTIRRAHQLPQSLLRVRAHCSRPEPRHIYLRCRNDEVTSNEDDIIFRPSATTTLHPTISAANRSSVADVVTRSQSAGLW